MKYCFRVNLVLYFSEIFVLQCCNDYATDYALRKKLRKISNRTTIYIDFVAKIFYNMTKHVEAIDGRMCMEISYKKLWILLIEKEISPATLRKDLNIATGTMTKMRRNEEVALSVLLRICEYLDCNIGDICDAVRIEE